MRVAFLHPCYWPEVRRGSERVIRELANTLIPRGYTPTLITSHPASRTEAVEDGLTVVRNRRPPGDARLRRWGFDDYLTHLPLSYATLRHGDFDLAHAFYPTDALAAARWSARTGKPSILSYFGMPDPARRLRWESTPRAARSSDAVTVLSRAAAAAMRGWVGIEPDVVYPGVDTLRFAPAGDRATSPTILCVGAADQRRKRIDLLVAAFHIVRRQRPGARLLLIAPGDRQRADQLRRDVPGVEFVDPRRDDLVRYYREAWVSVLPSYGEAFGVVLIESLACGTPVVGSNRDAFPEIVDRPEVGRLFDGDNEQALALALLEGLELGTDPTVSSACRARGLDFSTERCADGYEKIYRRLLDGHVPEDSA